MQAELRKHQNALIIIGSGVIAFGAWSMIKLFVSFSLSREELRALAIEAFGTEEIDHFASFIFYAIMAIIPLSVFLMRLYMGLSARAEGRGRKKGVSYLVLAVLFVVANTASILFRFATFFASSHTGDDIVDMIASTVMDATSLITLAELLYSASRVRKLTAETAQ